MIKIPLSIDPALARGLDQWARAKNVTSAALMRDILYTALWNEKRGAGAALRDAPGCPPALEDTPERYRRDRATTRLVRVDEIGLIIET